MNLEIKTILCDECGRPIALEDVVWVKDEGQAVALHPDCVENPDFTAEDDRGV